MSTEINYKSDNAEHHKRFYKFHELIILTLADDGNEHPKFTPKTSAQCLAVAKPRLGYKSFSFSRA